MAGGRQGLRERQVWSLRERGKCGPYVYTYTDISATFFERARKRWKGYGSRMTFKMHGLERTRESQGFEVGSYDLVVAGSVLHATADLERTTRNLQTALKAGGRALILEVVVPDDVVVNFSFMLHLQNHRADSCGRRSVDPCLGGGQASLVRNKRGTRSGKHVDSIVPLNRFHETRPGPGDIVLCLASLNTLFISNMSESKLA